MMLKHDFQSVNSLRDGFYMKPFLLLGSLKHQTNPKALQMQPIPAIR